MPAPSAVARAVRSHGRCAAGSRTVADLGRSWSGERHQRAEGGVCHLIGRIGLWHISESARQWGIGGKRGVHMARRILKVLLALAMFNALVYAFGRILSRQGSAGDELSADFKRLTMWGGDEFKSKAVALHSGEARVRGGGMVIDLREAGLDPEGAGRARPRRARRRSAGRRPRRLAGHGRRRVLARRDRDEGRSRGEPARGCPAPPRARQEHRRRRVDHHEERVGALILAVPPSPGGGTGAPAAGRRTAISRPTASRRGSGRRGAPGAAAARSTPRAPRSTARDRSPRWR